MASMTEEIKQGNLAVVTESPGKAFQGDDDVSALENHPYFSHCYKTQKDQQYHCQFMGCFLCLLWSMKLKSFCPAEETINTVSTAYRAAENLCQLYWRQGINI